MRSRILSSLLAMFLTFGTAASVWAADQTATWNNTTNNWTSANWSTANFPNNGNGGVTTYDAVVGGGVVTLNQDITIEKFNLTGGTLTGPTSFTLTLNDLFTWTGGTLTGLGNVAAGGGMTLSGTGSKNLEGSRVLTNDGTATLSGGYVQFTASGSTAPGAVLDNNGVFNATSDADILFNNIGGGQPSFSNDGTFNKSGAGTTTSIAIAFNNAGTVNVDSGTLALTTSTSSGNFSVASLATLSYTGAHTFNATSSISGAGTVNVTGTVTGAGTTSISGITTNLTGTMTGSGSVTFNSGVLNWTSGTMTGTGTTAIAAPATLNLSGTGSKNLEGSRVLTNDGTATLSGGYVQFTASGSLAGGRAGQQRRVQRHERCRHSLQQHRRRPAQLLQRRHLQQERRRNHHQHRHRLQQRRHRERRQRHAVAQRRGAHSGDVRSRCAGDLEFRRRHPHARRGLGRQRCRHNRLLGRHDHHRGQLQHGRRPQSAATAARW